MLGSVGQLAAAQLAFYLLLIFPAIYVLTKHGLRGSLGWVFLVLLCFLRIIGNALEVNSARNGGTSTTGQTLSGVGLSPLTLVFVGVLHESNYYVTASKSSLLRFWFSLIIHFLVAGALGLIVVGFQPHTKHGLGFQRTGYLILLLIWFITVGLTLLSWRVQHHPVSSKRILIGVTAALPFLGIRIFYSTVASFDSGISPFSGPIAYRVVLATLMEFIISIILLVFGIITRNICIENRRSLDSESRTAQGGTSMELQSLQQRLATVRLTSVLGKCQEVQD